MATNPVKGRATPAQWFYEVRNKIKIGEMKGFFSFHFPRGIIHKALTHFISVIIGQSEQWVLVQAGWDNIFL